MDTHAKSAVEGHSIDFIPESERTDKLSSQGPFWFLGNFTFFTMTIGFVGPSVGLSALWTILAGTLGIMNNMHVPAGLLVNLAIWQQQPHWPSFIIGAAVITASLWVHRRWVLGHHGQTADGRTRAAGSNE